MTQARSGGHDRRSFFRELLRGASHAASEVDALRRAADDAVRGSIGPDDDLELGLRPQPAGPSRHLVTGDELRRLCVDGGREAWANAAAALARTSVRLSPSGDGTSWLGGSPQTTLEWPSWEGGELAFVARIALDVLPPTALPAHGALLVFFALDRVPSGLRPAEAGACRVIHVDDAPAPDDDPGGDLPLVPVMPSAELTLPPAPAPTSLALDAWELEEWAELRERLAAAQGVELEERATAYHALHRLLGHADTNAAGMELDAELVSNGVDLEQDPYASGRREELAPGRARWRLLFQLSSDDELGVELGEANRLFVWIRDDDLATGRFDRVRAFVR